MTKTRKSAVDDLATFRLLVIAAQAITLLVTWPLWQARESFPNLPLFPVVQFDVGWLLLGSLVVIPPRPALGIALHTAILALALLLDQLRIQPEVISLAILLWGSLPWPNARLFCRAHLFSLWLFAGLHKLLSSDFLFATGARMVHRVLPDLPAAPATALAILLAMSEIALALLLIAPRTRPAAAWLACGLHLAVFVYLSPLVSNWNVAVWAWNIALAFSGLALFASWRTPVGQSFREARPAMRWGAGLLIVSPLAYYVGGIDAYLAHCLYSSNTPKAWLHVDGNGGDENAPGSLASSPIDLSLLALEELKVPFPPAHRLYDDYFRRAAQPSDSLDIRDPRWWARFRGYQQRTLTRDGQFVGGNKHGPWTLRHASGNRAAQGRYRHGREEGPWTFWFDDGRKEAEGAYRGGELHGKWTFWFEDGQRVEADYE